MIEIGPEQRNLVKPLFDGIEDSMVIAYFQGRMGRGFADVLPHPGAALIVSGEYCFFGGDSKAPGAGEFAERLFELTDWEEVTAIYRDDDTGWKSLLLSYPQNSPVEVPRYGIVQRDYDFDRQKLETIAAALPEGLLLQPFDKECYRQAMNEEWSRAFCDVFASAEEYLSQGFGFAVTDKGRLVAGASTMTVYDGGTETQVAAREEYRGRGLALAASAAFILECMARNMRPCWDAANETSLHMALKLGYEYKGIYSTVVMKRPEIMKE